MYAFITHKRFKYIDTDVVISRHVMTLLTYFYDSTISSAGEIDEYHKKPQSKQSVTQSRFDPSTSPK
jgi:hypothetical protein